MNKKVVLAYSGGLDTSFCVKYLTEDKGLEVHALTVNTGGFNAEELEAMEKKAYQLGAKSFKAVNAVPGYYDRCVKYLIFGNILRNNTYPLSVSAERMFQALEVVKYAGEIGADAIAHGSTGAGNDQVRFDLVFNVLGESLEIITPIRDLKLSRAAEIEYLQERGVDWSWEKAQYSINQGLWGTSVGGAETLTSRKALPEKAYPTPMTAEAPVTVSLQFENGQLSGIDGKAFDHPTQAIEKLQEIAGPYAIGRDVHVGDTIIGIKGRVGFEAAAPLIIIKAHHLLEKHTLTKWQQYWKEQLANWYGMLLHEGQYLDPVMRNIENFLEDTQEGVTGSVYVQLHPYRFELEGIESDYDLMNSEFGHYGEMNKGWSGDDVKGFTKILANQLKIRHLVHKS
ncbi:argininosuccinate synthase [Flavilitoribacter nigricans]|uniref:argininosuccinate synthase n=1 Tax=Flavilitoribacter nigricans (strain ATCC 23147 / DSM 23189 / NBRC 102662 / NCIMB 1420 / SS-2) TaxID=1122177 RepID=A0A2D0NAX2_FLAN2|nr:argininosuccinate synthase domain-containing protein [Flavilitoribacter nigricans]PHN05662.1 argininosuccinate synthase [Flavilitoribacter nigricans DSM 23189 = NBRC 102662]